MVYIVLFRDLGPSFSACVCRGYAIHGSSVHTMEFPTSHSYFIYLCHENIKTFYKYKILKLFNN